MGEIYKVSCSCGYVKELNIGGGLASCNINMVNKLFAGDKLSEFNVYYSNNEVQSFYIDNEFSICSKCQEILSIAVLKVQLTNNSRFEILNNCPLCSSKIRPIEDLYICPKCGQRMIKEEIGQWD